MLHDTPPTTARVLDTRWVPVPSCKAADPFPLQDDTQKPRVKPKWTLGFLPPLHLRLPDYDYCDLNAPSTPARQDEILLSDLDEWEPSDDTTHLCPSDNPYSNSCKRPLVESTACMRHGESLGKRASTSSPTVNAFPQEVCDQQQTLFAALNDEIQAFHQLRHPAKTKAGFFGDHDNLNYRARSIGRISSPGLFTPLTLSDSLPMLTAKRPCRQSLG